MLQSYNPATALTGTVWAFPCSLATTLGITICFLFLQLLRCFSSLGWLHYGFPDFIGKGLPIRKSSDQRLFASPRSLSQLITSFIAFKSLGILHAPLITFFSYIYIDVKCIFFQYVKELFSQKRNCDELWIRTIYLINI